MRLLLVLLVAGFALPACKGEAERKEYSCSVCGEYDPIIEQRNAEAEAAGCLAKEATRNGGITCTVDNIQYDQLVITYSDCEQEPPCAFDEFAAQGGSTGWDYECHICGDEGDVDSAHDGGAEDSGCRDTGILQGLGRACPNGQASTLVGFSSCDEVPACFTE